MMTPKGNAEKTAREIKRKECMNNQRRLRRLYWSEKNQITGSGL